MENSQMSAYHKVKSFLSQGVWSAETAEIHWLKAFGYRVVRFLEHATTGFLEDKCLLRASALTYTSLLSLIPLLALMFAILKGLGVQHRLEPVLLERFTGSQQLVNQILEYIDRTNVGSLGILGVVTLFITVVMVLKNMERSFNWIWNVKKGRSWLRTVSDYISVLLIAPICLLLAMSLTGYFQSVRFERMMESLWVLGGIVRFLIKASPYIIMWIAFTACYLFMPNTRVRVSSAVLGGIVGGTLWQLAQWGYVHYQIGVNKYNAIYGALSQLPILMVWVYLSWVILLFGAEVAFAHQNLGKYVTEKRVLSTIRGDFRAYWTLQLLKTVGERFQRGGEPYTVEELRERLQLPRSLLEPCLEKLEGLGWIAQRQGPSSLVVFKRSPACMPLHRVLGFGADEEPTEAGGILVEVLRRADEGVKSALGSLTVQDLID